MGVGRFVCFPIDLRIQVLNHNNKLEKLTFSEKIENTLFEGRISVFLIEKKICHMKPCQYELLNDI